MGHLIQKYTGNNKEIHSTLQPKHSPIQNWATTEKFNSIDAQTTIYAAAKQIALHRVLFLIINLCPFARDNHLSKNTVSKMKRVILQFNQTFYLTELGNN